ncbi:WD40 repeat protein [Humibacillus xanthopallidus]|uniref:WD40 repeat protein n=1 Tax=Humibacillus xanthopallidus TaxID=412689 RepID=A0A543PWW6_9MICO|nr:WD40 repeat domain-containing protein [Humibacillus xanthopallidus]TQN48577.1 WD40 repeat protein [Humibacillus xanthopallidus]
MAEETGDIPEGDLTPRSGDYHVDASGASGVVVGEGNTQFNYFYGAVAWSDRVAAPPLVTVSGDIESPYRGLNSFDERDAAFFFGRDSAVAELVGRVESERSGGQLIVVSGVSGSGKSSLLRAGLVPRLRPPGRALPDPSSDDDWCIVHITPSRAPLDALAVGLANAANLDGGSLRRGLAADPALARLFAHQVSRVGRASVDSSPPARVLLIVDQFEQIFTLCRDDSERSAFVAALDAMAGSSERSDRAPAVVVIGVRADFEARCADFDELAEPVQTRFLLTSMTERQLRTAITEPARVAGSQVEEELVRTLLDELRAHRSTEDARVAGRTVGAGALPLLSHALDQAWRSRVGPTLTLADYERTGGIEAAVSATAQSTYEHLTPRQRAVARDVFVRLTAAQTDGLDVSSQARRQDLTEGLTPADHQDVQTVLEAFSAQRLLTLDADTVEISHEAVLTAWPLLRDTWLAQTHADRLVRSKLRASADEWNSHDRDSSYLYQGALLAAAEDAFRRMTADARQASGLSQLEAAFLKASGRAHRRRNRTRRATMAAVAALIVGLTASTIWATRATVDAERAANNATQASAEAIKQAKLALSRQLLSQSESADTDADTARVMSLASWALDPSDGTRFATESTVVSPGPTMFSGPRGAVTSFAMTRNGVVLGGGSDGTIRRWDVIRRKEVAPAIRASVVPVNSIAVSPDSKIVAATTNDGALGLWRLSDGKRIGKPITGEAPLVAVAFSPDGRMIAATSYTGGLYLWKIADPRAPSQVIAAEATSAPLISLGKGDFIILPSWGSPQFLHEDTADNVRRALSRVGCDSVIAIAANDTAMICDGRQTMLLVDMRSRPARSKELKQQGNLEDLNGAFSPTGAELAISDWSTKRIIIRDSTTGQMLGEPRPTPGREWARGLIFSADGRTLIAGTNAGTICLWPTRPETQFGRIVARRSGGPYFSAVLNNVGQDVVAIREDLLAEVRNHTGSLLTTYSVGSSGAVRAENEYGEFTFSKNRRLLAYQSPGGPITVYDSSTGHAEYTFKASAVGAMAFSNDDRMLAWDNGDAMVVTDLSRHIQVARHRSLPPPDLPLGYDGSFSAIAAAVSPAGRLVVARATGVIEVFDSVTSTSKGHPLEGAGGSITTIAIDPVSERLVSGSFEGTIGVWDLTKGKLIGRPIGVGSAQVTALAISPDGRTLAEGRETGEIQLWDLPTRSPIGAPLAGHTDAPSPDNRHVASLDFSSDGKALLSAGWDGTIRQWSTAYVMNPVKYLCAKLDRGLLLSQWKKIAPTAPTVSTVCGP